jgi:hypothetical protein
MAKKYTAEELAEILAKHLKWRRGESDGARANLADANLAGADLTDADLTGADLTDANLADANLADANLAGADLTDADLTGANLAGADLTDADLTGADLTGADLTDADGIDPTSTASTASSKTREEWLAQRASSDEDRAKRFRERNPTIPVVEALDARILAAVTTGGGKLDMSDWHTCDTTHCRAGWAIHLAGQEGYALEEELGSAERAGRAIYRASTGRVPHFFASTDDALEDIKACAARESSTPESKQPA